MSIPRVKSPNWGIGEKLTSAQQNQLDTNVTYALDKRTGETDTIGSVITLGATGRIIQSVTGAPNADSTFSIISQVLSMRVGTPNVLTAQRSYTLSNTNAVNGDEISFFFDPDALGSFNVLIKDNGGATLATLGPSGQSHWGEFKFISGAWKLKRLGGMPLAAVTINVQMQGATNVQLATGNVTLSPARTITRSLPLGAAVVAESAAGSLGTSGSDQDLQELTSAVTTRTWTALTFAAVVTANAFARYWIVDLGRYVPNGATITSVAIELRGAGAHAALPVQMPGLAIRRSGVSDVALHSAGSRINDSSASTAVYQSTHGITATCNQNNVVDKSTYTYYAMILNEGSTNAIAGLIVQGLTITFTVPSVDVAP